MNVTLERITVGSRTSVEHVKFSSLQDALTASKLGLID